MTHALRQAALAAGLAFCATLPALAETAQAETGSAFGCSELEFATALPAIEGRDGVFYRTFSDLRMQHPLDDRMVALMGRLAAVLRENGTTLVYATVPSKSAGMPDPLPAHAADYGFVPDIAEAVYTDFITRLNAAGVLAPDLMTALQANTTDQPAFFGADFHWTSQGARLGAVAIAEMIKADPAFADLPVKSFVSTPIGPQTAFSGMRRSLQGLCTLSLPPTETIAYRTDEQVDPAADAEAGTLDIFATGDEVLSAVLVGTSYSDSPINNFAGFLEESTGLDIVNYAITGGNQYGGMTSYLTSDEFQAQRPRFLIWENPIYNNLAQYGTAPMEELIAAAGSTCTTALDLTRIDDRTVSASLAGLKIGPEDAIFADFGAEGPRAVDFTLQTDTGLTRHASIERSARLRATGNFYLGMAAYAMPGFTTVTVRFDRPVTDATALTYCPKSKGDAS
jgi:alginate biosynthesis protein AlgX